MFLSTNNMAKLFSLLFVFILYMQRGVNSLHLPSYIKACSKSDPNFNKCVLENSRAAYSVLVKGDRKYKLNSLQPLFITRLESDFGKDLSFTFIDFELNGFEDLNIDDIKFDLEHKKYKLNFTIPRLNYVGQYDINGKLLVLPIRGSGAANITFVGGRYIYTSDWELVNKAGREYMDLQNSKVEFSIERAYFFFDNLFSGDKTLGENMNKIINENWREVMVEMNPGMQRAMEAVATDIHKKYFDTVPYNEIFVE